MGVATQHWPFLFQVLADLVVQARGKRVLEYIIADIGDDLVDGV